MRCTECGWPLYADDEYLTNGTWCVCKKCAKAYAQETAMILFHELEQMDEVRRLAFAQFGGLEELGLEVDMEYGNN